MISNQKIQDFLEQAHTYSFQENRGQFVLNDFSERFAELIVRECADLVAEFSPDSPCNMANRIKKHFGVEDAFLQKIQDLINDLRFNHIYCPKEVILQAADMIEYLTDRYDEALTLKR